jgi:hypothetical protein
VYRNVNVNINRSGSHATEPRPLSKTDLRNPQSLVGLKLRAIATRKLYRLAKVC